MCLLSLTVAPLAVAPLAPLADAPEKPGNLAKLIHTTFNEFPQFSSASTIVDGLKAPAVQIPPPVLQNNGEINGEYFNVLAAKEGPLVKNSPATFKHNYPGKRSDFCNRSPNDS